MKNKPSGAGKAAKPAAAIPLSAASQQGLEKGPFSRLFRVSELPEQIPETGFSIKIMATPEECEALAGDFDLPEIIRIEAEFQIFRLTGGLFHIGGFVSAEVVEICVVSLDQFHSNIKAEVDLDLVEIPKSATDKGRADKYGLEPGVVLRLDGEEDPPQPITGGKIDLGAIASEFLALNLDPYPRKPGVEFEPLTEALQENEKQSPFEVLRKLKDVK